MPFDKREAALQGAVKPVPASSRATDPRRRGLQELSFAEQNAALRPKAKSSSLTMMQKLAMKQDPNERERAILEADADSASAWVRASSFAVGISGGYAATRPEGSSFLGRADALRHCLWSGYLAFMLGAERAQQLTDAHEDQVRPKDTNNAANHDMDKRNNAVGILLGQTARESGVVTRVLALTFITAAAMDELSDGGLVVVDQSKANSWKLVPSNTKGVA
jgi:hypothetical protein